MDITQLKTINNQNKIIFLTSSNSTPKKSKKFSFSNSKTSNQSKTKHLKKNRIKESIMNNNFSYKSCNGSQKYIFNCYKISPFIAIVIYEKAINKLFEFIQRRLSKSNFIEIKKKYISFVTEELHVNNKNILLNIPEKDLMNLNVKLFTSYNNSNIISTYSKFNLHNPNSLLKSNCNSNSLFQLSKNRIRKGKILSLNSFNTELRKQNQSLFNSSNIIIQPKKSTNICQTEYIQMNNYNNSIINLKSSKNKKIGVGGENFNYLRNLSMTSGSLLTKNNEFENKKKSNMKDKIINKDKDIIKIFRKMPLKKMKKINKIKKSYEDNNQINNENKNNNIDNNPNNSKSVNDPKDNEKKKSVQQLNLIKENLEDNLKNMFNFSYGSFLNYEKESDSSKSLYKMNNDYANNIKN
jgi:hypothetical protein